MTKSKYPAKLSRDSIAEATFEIRFTPEQELASELLLGMLYNEVRKFLPKLQSLPLTSIPKEIVARDKNLWYQPKHKLEGDHYILALGDKTFTLIAKRPYQGWKDYRSTIHRLLKMLNKTQVVKSIERFSLKYINLIPVTTDQGNFNAFKINAQLAQFDLTKYSTLLRTEIPLNGFINVVQLAANATVTLGDSDKKLTGTLLDIDTISSQPALDFWQKSDELIDAAHNTEKEVFFSLLTEETIQAMGPIQEA